MNTNTDELLPFLMKENESNENFGKHYEPKLPTARKEKVPLIERDENGHIRYINPNVPIKQVNPDASWVDKYGDTAVLNADKEQLSLTQENWRKILGHVNPNFWGDHYRHLLNFLENDEGLFYVDDLPEEMKYWHREGNSDFPDPSKFYPEPMFIPNFTYQDNETYEPPILLSPMEYYDDDINNINMDNYYYFKRKS